MTVTDLHCDRCGRLMAGPATREPPAPGEAVRLSYHPGDADLRDDATTVCGRCWAALLVQWGPPERNSCAVCASPVEWRRSLHLRRYERPEGWQLCRTCAVRFLNSLRTVVPPLDPESFEFPSAREAVSGAQAGVEAGRNGPSTPVEPAANPVENSPNPDR